MEVGKPPRSLAKTLESVEFLPRAPLRKHGLNGFEFFSLHGTGYGGADQVAAETVRLMIVHNQRVRMKFP